MKKTHLILSIILSAALLFSIFMFIKSGNTEKNNNGESGESKGSIATFVKLAKNILADKGAERNFLVLLQNNMELRPGGGFIGSFAIIKTKGEKVLSYEVHDTSNFDGRIPDTQSVPYPMAEIFGINAWKLRDSNYSPDFKINAEKALDFYYLGGGNEKFDGVIAVNVSLLEKILEFTGPVSIEGFPGSYDSKNVLINLEKQVEIDFENQGIERGDRKQILSALLGEILSKIDGLSILDKTKLFKLLTGELDNKNIQLYFKDVDLQNIVEEANWTGEVDREWKYDYLMVVDANLGAYKSDYYVKRSVDYTVDFADNKPKVTLKIKYNHTATEKNWFTKDYQSYLRVYVPEGSELESFNDIIDESRLGSELGKTYFGGLVQVETGKEKVIELSYHLPESISSEDYKLKIQKQSGVKSVPVKVNIESGSDKIRGFDIVMDKDIILEK